MIKQQSFTDEIKTRNLLFLIKLIFNILDYFSKITIKSDLYNAHDLRINLIQIFTESILKCYIFISLMRIGKINLKTNYHE